MPGTTGDDTCIRETPTGCAGNDAIIGRDSADTLMRSGDNDPIYGARGE